ncbi:hypothetical protein C8C76_10675 [Halanaerobium saccharolyticum]|jgi:hypothetical protein|uniref:Uncharacterized protein n=1 Tax=Halanaerobium saccharolyticum TaxID=43595 RepID=A0A2T5RN27_9FIRM|nr:hypothetical protein [Halanaerobium saccharolyticum]PTW00919.1 hypothetical protein C8C76_10675 [Halanaerobium saccharolyticum]
MSAFLGPIHMWLYNQIQIVEEREAEIVDQFSQKYSAEKVDDLIFPYRHQYGELKEDKPLVELIAGSDIHPWLEAAISSAQSREAAVVAALMDEFNDQELLLSIYAEQAEELAEKAKVRDDVDEFNLNDAFEIINEHFVERMPCDRLSGAVKEDGKIIWKHQSRLHQEFWQQTEVELELMHQLYAEWLQVFTENLNPELAHKREIESDYYNDIFFVK